MRISHTSVIKTFTTALVATIAISAFGATGVSAATSPPVQAQSVRLPKFGEVSESVKSLQTALLKNGFTLVGGVDGTFSPRTRATLRSFQKVVGLKATGNLDRKTAKVLGLLTAAPVTTPIAAPAPVAVPVVAPVAAPAPVAVLTFTPETLPVIGAKGDAVAMLQNALILAGVEVKGGADGVFGNGTKASITAFQKTKSIVATGKVDVDTAIELGLLPRPVLDVTIAVFPVQPACYFIDTWQEARGATRLHEGVDIIANRGTPLLAVSDGTITRAYDAATSALSGNALRLTAADGTYFFYAHLDSIAPGIAAGTAVKAGQVIGFVGSTGNTNTDHLHFEVHPKGGAAVNPFPIVKAVDACKKK
jgi:peptidoglycan hydrolase-like protein with peptidoglycan-binding domain